MLYVHAIELLLIDLYWLMYICESLAILIFYDFGGTSYHSSDSGLETVDLHYQFVVHQSFRCICMFY